MVRVGYFLVTLLLLGGCATQPKKMTNEELLADSIMQLSKSIDKHEARLLAHEAVNYSVVLADNYGVFFPAPVHNFLVNVGIKERGLCYEWAFDLKERLDMLKLKTIKIQKVVANKGTYAEHNALVATPLDGDYKNGILLDPWRSGGKLYWDKIENDPEYKWEMR